MKKWLWILLLALLAGAGAAEEALLPPGAKLVREEGNVRHFLVEETGEELVLRRGAGGEFASLSGFPAGGTAFPGEAEPLDSLEAALAAEYSGALILRGEESEAAGWKVYFLAESAAGWVVAWDGRVRGREVSFGAFIEDGVLTMAGARTAVSLHRPEARITEIELDEDDGLWLYEGEALFSGEEYEFELDARSAKLLEWERD